MQSLRNGRDWLVIAATAFLAANLVHGADHVRQEFAGFTIAVFIGGTLLTVQAVAVFVLARRRDPRAPLFAAVVGFSAAALVAAAHIAPHWGVLSDSYIDDIDPDALAWAVMLLEVATAFALGIVGVLALRARGASAEGLTASPEPVAGSSV